MRLSRRTRLAGVALFAAGSLTLAACGGGSDSDGAGGDFAYEQRANGGGVGGV